ncbi:hypothetical protein [Burkholderia multivorans]|uniref:hypothetical protein n=1 Tax=Burkholderia multivorans TaxID=87883 RepID=UPI001C23A2AA|nr:hypothetical protein [Burkholderia multivorans]
MNTSFIPGEILLDASEATNAKIVAIGPIVTSKANTIARTPRIFLIYSLHNPPNPPTIKAIGKTK